jgi:RNA-directed DNA polymerase
MPLRTPRVKKRTALLRTLKQIFRSHRSRPLSGVIAKINPILRGWVQYFAVGHSSRCFSYSRSRARADHAQSCWPFGFNRLVAL